MSDVICTFCNGQSTAGCMYCNPTFVPENTRILNKQRVGHLHSSDLVERIEQLEAATYRSEWGDLAKLHEEFKQHIAKQAKIIAAVEAVLIDHKGFHYGDNAVSVLCALEDALKGTCNVQNIR